MTKLELEKKFDDFFSQYNGQSLDYDGIYGGQCFDLIQEWNVNWLGGPFIVGEFAYQIYGQHPNFYTSIPNTPDAIPQKGDIVVWAKSYNGFAGHTGVATGKGDLNTFECFEQNDPTGTVCHLKVYNYNHVTGWLRLKNITETTGGVNVNDGKKAVQFDRIVIYLNQKGVIPTNKSEDYINDDKLVNVVKGLYDETERQSKQIKDLQATSNNAPILQGKLNRIKEIVNE